ncbi:MAG TPA: hypothetical protein VFU68_01100 [Terracidiphilus sp.]|nr:hypothetical protein [Terracidiphilus sp.]
MRLNAAKLAALALAMACTQLPAARAHERPQNATQDTTQDAALQTSQDAAVEGSEASNGAARPRPVFRVDFLDKELAPSQWTLVLYPDGTGHFHADRANSTAPKPSTIEPISVDREVKLSPEFTAWVFATVRANQFLHLQCQSDMKVAFQGWKTLSYRGPDGEGNCRFNYSKNKQIQALGESMVGVASTLMAGARLELLRQHEPLGLDSEMSYIVDAVGDGRLLQIYAIQGTLRSIAGDPDVMDRVKRQARKLLARADRGQ